MPSAANKLHPCWNCKSEMHIIEHGIAQVHFVCPNCGEETHKWFYARQAESERQSRCDGTAMWEDEPIKKGKK